jgi:hypothetical protein
VGEWGRNCDRRPAHDRPLPPKRDADQHVASQADRAARRGGPARHVACGGDHWHGRGGGQRRGGHQADSDRSAPAGCKAPAARRLPPSEPRACGLRSFWCFHDPAGRAGPHGGQDQPDPLSSEAGRASGWQEETLMGRHTWRVERVDLQQHPTDPCMEPDRGRHAQGRRRFTLAGGQACVHRLTGTAGIGCRPTSHRSSNARTARRLAADEQ